MLDFSVGLLAAFAYAVLFAAYLSVRPRGALSVMDMGALLFSMQFGPHAIIKHPFLESALREPGIYPAYATGLALAYFGLASGLFILGSVLKTRRIRLYPFSGTDVSSHHAPVILLCGALYIAFFIAYQGFDLSRTLSYLNFFRGRSEYTYMELRRELYSDDAALGLTALTRQTSSALLYGLLVYTGLRLRRWRFPMFLMAACLFVVCCMQMNKFPFLYYLIVSALIVYMNRCYETGVFITKRKVAQAAVSLLLVLALLAGLYRLQYGSEIDTGVVTTDRVFFRVLTRPFSANHDVLYLWFANFPRTFPFIGFSNVPILANLFGLQYFGPTTEIPDLYERVRTTYQPGYIGSAYASFGYVGVLVCSFVVGGLIAGLASYEKRINVRWQRIVFFAVVGMNCYFLVSRELHTAFQSGGLVLAPLCMAAYRELSSVLLRVRVRVRVRVTTA